MNEVKVPLSKEKSLNAIRPYHDRSGIEGCFGLRLNLKVVLTVLTLIFNQKLVSFVAEF